VCIFCENRGARAHQHGLTKDFMQIFHVENDWLATHRLSESSPFPGVAQQIISIFAFSGNAVFCSLTLVVQLIVYLLSSPLLNAHFQ